MLYMDWMIDFIMLMAVHVCRLTVFGSVDDVVVANFH